jgi:RNA polymerase sigma-70 factor (ECF subfamily)
MQSDPAKALVASEAALPSGGCDVKPYVGDPRDAAFRRHYKQVFHYLRRRIGNDELAEDLTQDVFLAAAAHLADLDEGRLLSWLYTVAQNRLIDEVRRLRRRPQLVSLELVADRSEFEYRSEVADALRKASLRLSSDERKLIWLRLFGETSFADLATRFGTSEPAIKMRYLRTLRALRAALEREGVEP